jgi:cellulose synthase (UDP-forming)
MGLIIPILYLLLDIKTVRANLGDVVSYFLPYYIWNTATMNWTTRGRQIPIMSDACQFIAAPEIIKAVVIGLAKPQGQKFKVTAKGGDRDRRFVEWPLLRFYGALLLLTVASIGYAFHVNVRGDGLEFGVLALFWSWYNCAVLLVVCFVCVEQPRRRKAERFETKELVALTIDGVNHLRQLIDISISGAQISGLAPGPKDSATKCRMGNCVVEARIVRINPSSFAVSFDGSLAVRYAMIRHFYSGQYVKAIESVNVASVTEAVARRLFR